MQTIHKYPLKIIPEQPIAIPRGGQVLTAQAQDNKIVLWALVDDENPCCKHYFEIHATGGDSRVRCGQLKYINTVQLDGYVWHVFERVSIEL